MVFTNLREEPLFPISLLLQHQWPFVGLIQHVSFMPLMRRHFIFFLINLHIFLLVFLHHDWPIFELVQHEP
jgi:hypothetical protein